MESEIPLGKPVAYSGQYDAGLLCSIPRADSRSAIGLGNNLPFNGCDIWTAWELTWLTPQGVPRVASAEILVPAYSPRLIESKSLKLYLGSFAMTHIESTAELRQRIKSDLDTSTGSDIELRLHAAGDETDIAEIPGTCIDSAAVECETFEVDPGLLEVGADTINESVHSHLLRSLCPVTGQPDLGSIAITYGGPAIPHASLLRYLVSYREHHDFHEACVERIFVDLLQRCRPERLTVYARYQRRGGIDINPFRSNFEAPPSRMRLRRQ